MYREVRDARRLFRPQRFARLEDVVCCRAIVVTAVHHHAAALLQLLAIVVVVVVAVGPMTSQLGPLTEVQARIGKAHNWKDTKA